MQILDSQLTGTCWALLREGENSLTPAGLSKIQRENNRFHFKCRILSLTTDEKWLLMLEREREWEGGEDEWSTHSTTRINRNLHPHLVAQREWQKCVISDAWNTTWHSRWDVKVDVCSSVAGCFQPYLGVWWVAMVERQGVVVLKERKKTADLLFQ